jgi:hypothetical protein
MKYFSPATFGFYDGRVHSSMPEDVIELSDDEYIALLEGQSKGKSIQYNDGVISLIPSELSVATVLRRLEADLHTYIEVTRGYSIPTQVTFQTMAADPSTPDDIREQCRSVSQWIQKIVLPYYYNIKKQIKDDVNPSVLMWDFKQACDSSSPSVTLTEIIEKV